VNTDMTTSMVYAMQGMARAAAIKRRLVLRRLALHLTQRQLAEIVGRTRETVNRWENGKTDPTASELSVWASVIGCAIDVTEPVTSEDLR
jgi:transcriptional regulator with XRE-family HTH domain